MLPVKNIFDELIKSTLLTISLFSLFDITVEGYQYYHGIMVSITLLLFISYTLYKYFHQHY